MDYTCTIKDGLIHCTITSEQQLDNPILCLSAMAPITIVDGGKLCRTLGGYSEIELPDLAAAMPHAFTLAYTGGFKPANRAWMPFGPYLRVEGRCIALTGPEQGFKPKQFNTEHNIDSLRLAPQPRSWQPARESVCAFKIGADHALISDPAIQAVAALAERRRYEFPVHPKSNSTGLALTLKETALPEDAYQLQISPEGIVICAGSYGGKFYAAITLLTLIRTYEGQLPCGIIEDQPQYGWRGQHLDTARHYYKTSTLFELLDSMSLLKLNRFHWHFVDDEAFRLQLDCCKELWQKTEMRGEGHLLPALFSNAIEAGGSYSKTDVHEVVSHAKALNIEVMPELEAVSHALAIASVYPDTRDPNDTGTEISVQGYTGNILNPAMPRTWELLNAMVIEVAELFPFNHLHIGCDELPENTWSGSPKAQALMKTESLKTTDDLLGWTANRLATIIKENGQQPAAWEEAARGSNRGIGNDAILFSWSGQGPGLDAAKAGYQVVMCPAQHVYMDMAHTDDLDDWGANWAAYVDLEDTIAWQVCPDEPGVAENIIGVQGAFWSEFTSDDNQIWSMLLPRMIGVASKAWQTDDIKTSDLLSLAAYYQPDHLNVGTFGSK